MAPLWTGGIDGSMNHIHETGIIGSMRWWYEAIVRGLGGRAYDPSRHECPDKDDNYRAPHYSHKKAILGEEAMAWLEPIMQKLENTLQCLATCDRESSTSALDMR